MTSYNPLVRVARDAKILGGSPAILGEFPHQVAIFYNDNFICGGSIISTLLVLTAAHCVFSLNRLHLAHFKVVAGLQNIKDVGVGEQIRNVKIIYNHENFVPETFLHDIAIVLLSEPFQYNSTIENVNLPRKDENFHGYATVSGWGRTEERGNGSVYLRKVNLPLVSRDVCRARYQGTKYNITDDMVCMGGGLIDSCQGDSGGAALCTRSDSTIVQCGIVSFGVGCGRKDIPGVYTLLPNYIDWIYGAEKQILLMECVVNNREVTDETPSLNLKPLENEYSRRNKDLTKVLDEARSTVEKTGLEDIEMKSMKEMIHFLENTLKTATREILKQKYKSIQLCIENLSVGEEETADIDYKWLKDGGLLGHLVKYAYNNYGKLQSLNYMSKFIDALPTCAHENFVITALLDALKKNGHQNSIEVLSVSSSLKYCPDAVHDLYHEVKNLSDTIVETLGDNVRTRNCLTIYEFVTTDPEAFQRIVGNLIKSSYKSNIRNAERVLEFINGVPLKTGQVLAYHVLFDEMRKSSGFSGYQMIMLANRTHNLTSDTGVMEAELANITSSLTSGIRALVYEPSIVIWSKAAAASSYYLGVKDSVLLACPSNTSRFNQMWTVQSLKYGRYFRLEIDRYRLKIGDGSRIYQNDWQVIPNYRGTFFYFKNRFDNKSIIEVDEAVSDDGCSSITFRNTHVIDDKILWSIS